MKKKVVIITGASSGMGKAAARLFVNKDWIVFGGARHESSIAKDDSIVPIHLDVTDSSSIDAFMETVWSQTDHVDVLINAVGYGEYGPVEEVPIKAVKKEFDTNLFGAIQMTQHVLPSMRKNKMGRIVNVSSGVGNSYMPSGAYYSASKAALQIWSDTLNIEVQPFGIQSTVIMPGATKTDFITKMFASFERNTTPNSPYAKLMNGVAEMSKNFSANATAEDLANVFYKAATDSNPKLRYFNTFSDRLSVYLSRNHPTIWKMMMSRTTNQMMNK